MSSRLSLPVWQQTYAAPPLPMTRAEMAARGWNSVDIVFVTGDAYVDHPSFAMAILGRVLEAAHFRVAVLSQPDWHSCAPWRQFGRPRVFFGISAGNMDSLINHYHANRKLRNDDAYSPGGRIGLRPDRATLPYCHRAREAFPGVPIIAGGVEASLRRLAHYDYWSDTVRRSVLLDSKADLLAYGMAEHAIVEIARRPATRQAEMDAISDFPYPRRAHPAYTEPIPAYEMIKDSVTLMRGCFGGCTFCSITTHQGRIIQSRSQESVLKDVRKLAADPEFSGVISDIGGPPANMYGKRCPRPRTKPKGERA